MQPRKRLSVVKPVDAPNSQRVRAIPACDLDAERVDAVAGGRGPQWAEGLSMANQTTIAVSYLEYPDCNVWQGTVQQLLDAGVLLAGQVPQVGRTFNFFAGVLTRRRPALRLRGEGWMRVHLHPDGIVNVTAWVSREARIERAVRRAEQELLAGRGVASFQALEARLDADFQHWLNRTVNYWTGHPNMPARGF